MKEINLLLVTTLLALLVWIGIEVRQVSREDFITNDLLETTTPIDDTIDTSYIIRIKEPANVQ